MNRAKTIFRCFMLGFAMLSGLRVSALPADLAEDLAALVAEGRGVLMPNLDEAHVEYRGVQVDGNSVYITDPGCDLFRNAVNVPGKVFVGGHDVWSLYHCNYGELHCGSEAERAIPALPPWWQRPEFENWPYEKKGMSP